VSELRIIAERIKKRVGVREIASRFGFDYKDQGDRARYACPICRESSSSKQTVSVFEGDDGHEHWHCFSCDTGGDCISWLAARLDLQPYQSIQRLATILGVSADSDAVIAFLSDSLKIQTVVDLGTQRSTLRAVRAEWWKWKSANPEATVDDVVARLPVIELAELRARNSTDSTIVGRVRGLLSKPTAEIPKPGRTPESSAMLQAWRLYRDAASDPESVEFLSDRVVDAPDYIRERKWLDVDPFSVGYCPVGFDRLPDPALEGLGVYYSGRRGSPGKHAMDGRVVFPIRNLGGQIVAFAGRTIVDDKAKYLNTRENPRFKKDMVLFGLFENLRSIVSKRVVIVVEGYADVLAMRRHGSRLSVAAMGTAITPHHAEILSRVADEVVLLLDGDKAGREASVRAVDVLRSTRYRLSVATLPSGKDPDDCRRAEIRAALAARRPAEREARGPAVNWLERLLTRS